MSPSTPQNPSAEPAARRPFWSYIAVQAQGAFSDNLYRMTMLLYVSAMVGQGQANTQGNYNTIIGALFPISYLAFSCWAGFLADKFSKRNITVIIKAAEAVIMAIAAGVLFWGAATGGPRPIVFWASVGVLLLMFSQSAFFNPSKYGIIPELVGHRRLGWANGIVNMTTNLGIIAGLALAPELFQWTGPERAHYVPLLLIGFALAGTLAAVLIGPTPRHNPDRPVPVNFFPELGRYIRLIRQDRTTLLTVLGLAYFWGVASAIAPHLLVWGKHSLGLGEADAGRIYWMMALGVAAGSALSGMLSRTRIEYGLIPIGALGFGLFMLPLGLAGPEMRWLMVGFVILLGASAGLYVVPLNAILQDRATDRDRGGILAANNYFSQAAILGFFAFYAVLNGVLKLTPNQILTIFGAVTLVGTVVVLRLLPGAMVRLVGFLLTHLVYRIRVFGREHLPREGGALLVSNHMAYVDALLILAVSPRPVRFLAYEGFFKRPIIGFFLRVTGCIPVGSKQRPRDLIRSLEAASDALAAGELVCIFAEGQLSRTGVMGSMRKGYEVILKKHPAPVIPVQLSGVWGSIFSFERGRFFWKWPRRIPYPVQVGFGAPLEPIPSRFTLRQAITGLAADMALASRGDLPRLHERLVRTARRQGRHFAMVDVLTDKPVTWGAALVRAVILARRLAPHWKDQKTIGVLLPPSVAGATVNFAAALSGRTVVNLNYTIGQRLVSRCAEQAGLKTVVTARKFLEKVELEAPVEPIYIEDYRGKRPGVGGLLEILGAALMARLAPLAALVRYCGGRGRPAPDDPATILFSSGSTGDPKGIVLTQANVSANVQQFHEHIRILSTDRMLGVLPFFHAFGYTVTLWGAAAGPFGVVYHVSPLDVRTIGELCERHRVSIIVNTPTFLQQYLKRLEPSQLGGLSAVVAGAERLPEALREAFRRRFGVEPLQGYGTTECAPVVSCNVDDFRSPGFYQVGHKPGTIGRPLPGIAVRVVEPESGAPIDAPDTEGILQVRGANVMPGYLELPEKTAEVLREGWYHTGDMARIDEDGFITITGRLSRFSKIGGEMVPHVTVEERLREALGLEPEEGLVVAAVPDAAKGERLVVLHTLDEARLEGLGERLAAEDLPNLWIPRRENLHRVEEIPVLGSGKLDLKAITTMAHQCEGLEG